MDVIKSIKAGLKEYLILKNDDRALETLCT